MKPLILVVEDDADFREVLVFVLEREGYAVVAATDGSMGLDLLRWGVVPRVVLLDLMMPIVNGWEFRRRQLADPELASIPVVVLSADPDAHRLAETPGVHDVLTKPVDFEQLLASIRHLLTP